MIDSKVPAGRVYVCSSSGYRKETNPLKLTKIAPATKIRGGRSKRELSTLLCHSSFFLGSCQNTGKPMDNEGGVPFIQMKRLFYPLCKPGLNGKAPTNVFPYLQMFYFFFHLGHLPERQSLFCQKMLFPVTTSISHHQHYHIF